MAPTETPLISERAVGEARTRDRGSRPCTEFAAVAVTPVRLVLELMAVAFAVALSAVTPAGAGARPTHRLPHR